MRITGSSVRVLVAHNYYREPGGEDEVYAGEARMLEQHGHHVVRYAVHNDSLRDISKLTLASRTIWSRQAQRELRTVMRRERPHVAHFHNTLPLISPAGYYSASGEGIPVVQTLHNYRLVCPSALLYRSGARCGDCVGKPFAFPGIVHRCYRGSAAATAVVATMTAVHRLLGTWSHRVALYITPTHFARRILLGAGLPSEKVVVKPHFVDPDPGMGRGAGGYALFVGRLSAGKGIETLLAAWSILGRSIPLRVVGDGPLGPEVARAARLVPGVEWLGRRTAPEVLELLRDAVVLVCPSEWYETFGRVIIEAFAAGTPVVGADIGAIAELVQDGRTGLLFRPGDVEDLAAKVQSLLDDPRAGSEWRAASRREFEDKYTAESNYVSLTGIYETAMRQTGGLSRA
jgi:glycosyltransferase involved in cell wall biosynthesis